MFVVRIISLGIFLISLSACGQKIELQPEEVVRRAIIRSSTVESVAASVVADMKTENTDTLSGSVIMQGIIRSGGQSWSTDSTLTIESATKRGHERVRGRLVMVSPGNGQTYLRLESVEGVLGELLRNSMPDSTSGWMVFGNDSASVPSARSTPDPERISSYADVIIVQEDVGMEKDDDGQMLYHYRVGLHSDALASLSHESPSGEADGMKAVGEMWIESGNFSLRKVKWFLTGVPTSIGPMTMHIDVLFTQYDAALQIRTPVGSAATLPLESIFAIFSL